MRNAIVHFPERTRIISGMSLETAPVVLMILEMENIIHQPVGKMFAASQMYRKRPVCKSKDRNPKQAQNPNVYFFIDMIQYQLLLCDILNLRAEERRDRDQGNF